MTKDELISEIRRKQSFLCIGLDSDIEKIPVHLLKSDDPVFEFNKQIIDATSHLCIAYKPNLAFYESQGIKGWQSLSKTIDYLRNNYPEIFTIADAKRGDIGNTSLQYAKAFLDDKKGFGFTHKANLTNENKHIITIERQKQKDGTYTVSLLVHHAAF